MSDIALRLLLVAIDLVCEWYNRLNINMEFVIMPDISPLRDIAPKQPKAKKGKKKIKEEQPNQGCLLGCFSAFLFIMTIFVTWAIIFSII